MCYGLKCKFEYSNGECSVKNYDNFKQQIGLHACYVGGVTEEPTDTQIDTETQQELIVKAKQLSLTY